MASIPTAYAHLMGNYKFQTSNYVMYIYDHLLTLPDEIDKIWSQPFSFGTMLFYINRYITHCQFIILQVEFYETTWSISMCDRYVKFAGAATLCLVAVAELIMILRIYALYLANKYVLVFLLAILSGQVIASAWGVHYGIRVPQPAGFPGCVLTGSNTWFAALWGAPLVTDSCIFLLTLLRMMKYRKGLGLMSTMKTLLRDGTMYFFVIFSANLMNTLIYFLAVEDLKAVGASFSQLLTSIMISRLQLNLRRGSSHNDATWVSQQTKDGFSFQPRHLPDSSRVTTEHGGATSFFALGDLGEQPERAYLDDPLIKDLDHGHIELHDRPY